MPYYAVAVGRNVGYYMTWDECKAQVQGFPSAKYKKFDTEEAAEEYIEANSAAPKKIEKTPKPLKVKTETSFKAKSQLNYATKDRNLRIKEITDADTRRHEFTSAKDLPTSPVVYTDGCCLNNGKASAVGGVGVYWAPQHPKNISEYLNVEKPTNQKAELRAASRALEVALEMGLKSIELRTDSIYTIKSMTEWIKRWQENGWKTAGNKDVVNVDEMVRLAELCKQISVKWIHVDAHIGIYGNEEADRLAREGAGKQNCLDF